MPGILKALRGSSSNSNQFASPAVSKRTSPTSMSIMSGLDNERLRKLANEDVKAARRKDIAIMLLVILIPIFTLIALASAEFAKAVKTHEIVEKAKALIKQESEISPVTLNLQVERGMTAMFLSSKGANKDAFELLLKRQTATDESVEKITSWPNGGIQLGDQAINSSNDLRAFLQLYRNTITSRVIPFEYNIRFYTNITNALMLHCERMHDMPSTYSVWKYMLANSAILRVSDAVGIQRAIGSTFFTLCKFSSSNFVWFMSLEGEMHAYFETAFHYCKECKEVYSSAANKNRELLLKIEAAKLLMGDLAWQNNCTGYLDTVTKFSNSQAWFDDITDYIGILKKVRFYTQDLMNAALDDIAKTADISVTSYSVIVIVITFGSLGIGYFYTRNVQNIISSVRIYTQKLRDKASALAAEKNLTEILLHQMLPKTVAEQLKFGKFVVAEHFACVTIMFSDIVGFTKFASSITPLQVVDVLNDLYKLLDDHLDYYDAYKVETIGDAYMIVSGAPQRNGNRHAMEVADIAITFMMAVVTFKVPHAPTYQMKMRIGLHSGPCEAGVVGVKMPRYCLFGETVVMAGYMENTAKEMTIHISETTKKLLASNTAYVVKDRGEILIKGMKRNTFWLLSGVKKGPDALNHPHFEPEVSCMVPSMGVC